MPFPSQLLAVGKKVDVEGDGLLTEKEIRMAYYYLGRERRLHQGR